MEINWFIFVPVTIAVILLVYFLITQNKKDRKKIEEELGFLNEADEVEINNDQNL